MSQQVAACSHLLSLTQAKSQKASDEEHFQLLLLQCGAAGLWPEPLLVSLARGGRRLWIIITLNLSVQRWLETQLHRHRAKQPFNRTTFDACVVLRSRKTSALEKPLLETFSSIYIFFLASSLETMRCVLLGPAKGNGCGQIIVLEREEASEARESEGGDRGSTALLRIRILPLQDECMHTHARPRPDAPALLQLRCCV